MIERNVLVVGVTDLQTCYPNVAVFWSPKNKNPANEILPGSATTAHWECTQGHEWENPVRQEIKKENHCKQCLTETTKPTIVFDTLKQKYSSNNTKPFTENLPQTKPLKWECFTCGSEYQQTIKKELKGINCPYCAGKKIKPGLNDIFTLVPELEKYWHESNIINPKELGKSSVSPVTWFCNLCEGTWVSMPSVQMRKRAGRECPYCTGMKLLKGFNDITSTHPEKAKQFNNERNTPKKATDYLQTVYDTVWWKNPECEHEWQQPIRHRMQSPNICSVCSGETIIAGINSLLDKKPYIQKYWNYNKNNAHPNSISPNSTTSIYLTCELGHTWKTKPKTVTPNLTCQICANKQVLPGINDLATTHPHLEKQWHPTLNLPLTPNQISAGTHTKIYWVCKKGHQWSAKSNDRTNYKTGCPQCVPRQKSQAEDEIHQWLTEQQIKTHRHERKTIGTELDLYLPDYNIAIEYNGIYWHTEKFKPKNYHHDKWKACKNKGIQLIQIWEDDWNRNPELIKKMLAHKIGIPTLTPTIFARKTKIEHINKNEAKIFLNQNHIQGFASGTHYLALKQETRLVAVLVLKKEKNEILNIIRYATSETVAGGFTKLLNFATKTYQPSAFITFSDNCVSNGNLYSKNGFEQVKQIAPDYMYIIKSERKHKFGYRLKRFRNDPNLKFEENLTEKQLAELNNIPRIWDAGKTKWVKKVKN